MAEVYSLEDARRRRKHAKRLSAEERRQIAWELAELVGVPKPTTEELRRMKQEIPADVLADDPPYGDLTPPKLLAQYYLWQTLDELCYRLTDPDYRLRESSPQELDQIRDFLRKYQRFAGPGLRETLQYYL